MSLRMEKSVIVFFFGVLTRVDHLSSGFFLSERDQQKLCVVRWNTLDRFKGRFVIGTIVVK